MALYQLLVPAFCLLLILKAWSHFLRGEKTIRELVGWIIFWGCISIIAIVPEITSFLAALLGIKSNINALLFSGIGILSYLSFKLLIDLENTEHQITKLTRVLALKEIEKEINSMKNKSK